MSVQNYLKENGISIRKVKIDTLKIAQNKAPKDTGNLAFNALRKHSRGTYKWTIKYDTLDAYYITPLQTGWTDKRTGKFHSKHKNFIGKTVGDIGMYLFYVFQPSGSELSKKRKEIASRISRDARSSVLQQKNKLIEFQNARDYRNLKSISRVLSSIAQGKEY